MRRKERGVNLLEEKPALLWLRQDLRISDNPALAAAAKHPFFAVYIWDENDPWAPGEASRWWLHKSLNSLKQSFEKQGIQLIFRRGEPLEVLKHLIQETRACALYWNRCYEPYAIRRDKKIKSFFKNSGVDCQSFQGSLLVEPWEIQTRTKGPYQIFTPFWKVFQTLSFRPPLSAPMLRGWKAHIISEEIDTWGFNPTLWGQGLEHTWKPGEKGACEKLNLFLEDKLKEYTRKRDYPCEGITSSLSPHLHWGEISPNQVWHKTLPTGGIDSLPFLRQLGWREFSAHLIFHFPDLPNRPLRPSFENFPWEEDAQSFKAWQTGKTGYPLIDAGMRELWQTGYMHNRVRMLVASFLIKDLLISWQKGEEWFWNTLVDADLANNAASWQWVAGCGIDASPYHRVFNPSLQSQKFDPEGAYIKQWVPELHNLNAPYIHCPWEAPAEILQTAGVHMGATYPFPIVDHNLARKRALIKLKTQALGWREQENSRRIGEGDF